MSSRKVNKVNIPTIQEIKSPEFLKDLNYKELDLLSKEIRDEILRCTAKNGGHLSSNLGAVESTIALHRVFDFKKDKLIFDVGHQCYTHKILTGRSLENLRKKDGASGFQKVTESEYDPFDAGHSSTSISVADGFAIARDLAKENYEVVAFIGDGSIASGLAFEGLNNVSHSNHKVIIVLNDNDMSISRPVGGLGKSFAKISLGSGYNKVKRGLSKLLSKNKVTRAILNFFRKIKNWIKFKLVPPTFFDSLGYTFIGPIDGHNIKAMEKAFKKAKNVDRSVIIDIVTTKGKGYKFAENDTSGSWHGVTPFNLETGEPLKKCDTTTWSNALANITLKNMEKNDKLILISPATLKGSDLEEIFNRFPDRALDVGIAEEHAMTLAGGLSKNGYHPVVDIYSTFMQRAYDEISHDIARMNVGATIVVDRSGVPGNDGETHQGTFDAGIFSATPNCVITMPSSVEEADKLFSLSLSYNGPFFIRIPRGCVKPFYGNSGEVSFAKWYKKIEGSSKKVAVVSTGSLINELAKEIDESGKDVTLFNALFIAPIDLEAAKELLSYERVVIYDPYSTQYGLATNLTMGLVKLGYKGKIETKTLPNAFIKQASIDEQIDELGLKPSDIVKIL